MISADDAKAAARRELQRLSHGLHPDAGLAALRHNLKCSAGLEIHPDESLPDRNLYTGEHPEELIEAALSGDGVAHEALCEIALQLVGRRERLPAKLGEYIVDAAMQPPPGRTGNHPQKNHWRDFAICKAIAATGLAPTRNESSDNPCGASIVSEILPEFKIELSVPHVMKIWKKRHPNWIRAAE